MNIACQNCPARLLNEDKVIFNDIGNSIANAMFVIPQHNEDAVNDIIRIYNRASNKVFEEHCLLSCAVKCKLGNDYKVFDSSVIQCKRIFFEVWLLVIIDIRLYLETHIDYFMMLNLILMMSILYWIILIIIYTFILLLELNTITWINIIVYLGVCLMIL